MRDSTANDPRIGASLADGVHAVALPFLVTRLGELIAGAIAAVVAGYTPIPGHASSWRLDADPLRSLPR